MSPKEPSVRVFAPTIGLSAFLLFQVQFMVAKELLPLFGGSPSVWTTCMLFFQVVLLLGYLYAHASATATSRRTSRNVHLFVLAAAVLSLSPNLAGFMGPRSDLPAAASSPIATILLKLLLSVGLPAFVLSSTGPLVQSWFFRVRTGASPYRLYALSNLGSLLGLVGYPILVEPLLSLPRQAFYWSLAFGLFATGSGACAISAARVAPDEGPTSTAQGPSPGFARRFLWFVLSLIPSILLLAETNEICQDVATVPFLWVLPLTVYLLSFVLCFEREDLYSRYRTGWFWALVLGIVLSTVALFVIETALAPLIAIHLFTLLGFCMVFHGELVRRRPGATHLTSFYLTVASGGAAGGLFTALLAPALFPAFWELPLAIFGGSLLLFFLLDREEGSWLQRVRSHSIAGRLAIDAALVLLGAALATQAGLNTYAAVHVSRNFFGVLKVTRAIDKRGQPYRKLVHGGTTHGLQLENPALRRFPTAYYGLRSGAGLTLRFHPARGDDPARPLALHVGLVGLGAGTLATYARPDDAWRFYEINPAVVALTEGPEPLFTFLKDSPARITTVLGDARLSLAAEAPWGLDVLVLDAFSGDSIPVHLLTREAMAIYRRHLKPSGILAIHISNWHIELEPVVRGVTEPLGLAAVRINSPAEGDLVSEADWMLVSENAAVLSAVMAHSPDPPRNPVARRVLWTDQYSDLLRLLKW